MTRYESAREAFKKYGINTDAVIEKLKTVPVAVLCWQGDDVTGFDHDGPLTGGIQTTATTTQPKLFPTKYRPFFAFLTKSHYILHVAFVGTPTTL